MHARHLEARRTARPRACALTQRGLSGTFSTPRRPRLTAAASSPRDEVLALLESGCDNYSPAPVADALAAAVGALVAANPTPSPGAATLARGDGTWRVFHAPHLRALSTALGTRFDPIRYTLRAGVLLSHVRYSSALLGCGWLSASGTLAVGDDDDDGSVRVTFTRFWVDGGGGEADLRPELLAAGSGAEALPGWADALVTALGRAAFIPRFATFPVLYLDESLAVFKFRPTNSVIAVRRTAPAALLPEHAGG